jgi:hypothetical protein
MRIPMKKTMKFVLVIAAASLVGHMVGRAIVARAARAVAYQEGAGPIRDVADDGPPFGRRVELVPANLGRPGQLVVRGMFKVGSPNVNGYGPEDFVMSVFVYDENHDVVIDGAPLGFGSVVPGIGHWEQDFTGVFDLAPGQYSVEMRAVAPGRFLKWPDGRKLQYDLAAAGQQMWVD